MGPVADKHRRAYEAVLEIQRAIIEAAKPGILASKLVDPGLMPTREICVSEIMAGEGFAATKGDGLSVQNLEKLISDTGSVKRIGIETFDKFPAPIYAGIIEKFSDIEIVRSTIVEELRMVKSEFDL